MSATATTEKKYLKWYQKLAYGSGDLASNCSYGLVSSFVLLYLTGTLGLDSAIIGSLMLASKVLDGISDVIFGTLIDRTHSKLGKARPWMLFGQVGVSLCLFLLFAIPAGSTTMQYIYFFIVYTALNAVFYTANGIAYSSLVALITKIIGCGLAAKICRFNWDDSLKVGVGMMTRGEVALIVAQKGLAIGVVDPVYFTAVILLIVVSSVATPLALKAMFTKHPPVLHPSQAK